MRTAECRPEQGQNPLTFPHVEWAPYEAQPMGFESIRTQDYSMQPEAAFRGFNARRRIVVA